MSLNSIPTKREWIIPLTTIIISLFVSAFVGYSATDKDTEKRISVLESQRVEDARRMERIEDKVDRILERLSGR